MSRRRPWRALLLSLAALIATAGYVLYSESALRWGVAIAVQLVKPLEISEAKGRLAGPFTLGGIRYNDAGRQLSLERLKLDWKPSALWFATAHVTTLHAEGLSITLPPEENAPPRQKQAITLPAVELPLRFVVDQASIDRITLNRPKPSTPLGIHKVSLSAETHEQTLRLHSLRFDSDWLTLRVEGTLKPQQAYPLELALEWQIPQQDAPPWRGNGTLQGDLRRLTIKQQLASPFAATLALNATELLDKLAWEGKLDIPRLESNQLPLPSSPVYALGASLEASGDLDSFRASASFAGQVETVGAIEGSIAADYAQQRLHLERLLISRYDHPSRIEASGDIKLGTPLRYQLEASWQELTWPLEAPTLNSQNGQLRLSGEEMSYRFDSELSLGGTQIPQGQWLLEGAGERDNITLSRLEGKLLDGSVNARATLEFEPALKWQGSINTHALNPALMWPDWPGRLAMDAAFSGEIAANGPQMSINLSSLGGSLRERKLQGHGEAHWRDGVTSIPQLELQLGSARLQAAGTVGDVLDFQWQLQTAALEDLLPQAQGTLKAEGRLNGPLLTPRVTLQLEGDELVYAEFKTAELAADIDLSLDVEDSAPSRVNIEAEQLQLPGLISQSLTLDATGSLGEHHITLSSRNEQQALTLAASAGYAPSHWTGTIEQLQIDDASLGQWGLAQVTPFSLSAAELSVERLCLQQNTASLCASGRWEQHQGLGASLESTDFPLALLSSLLPAHLGVEGLLDGNATLAVAPERAPRLDARLRLGQGQFQILMKESHAEVMTLPFLEGTLHLDSDAAGKVQGEFSLALNESDTVELNLQTSLSRGLPAEIMQHPLESQLRVDVQDLDLLSSLVPEVQNATGHFTADVMLSGSLAEPQLSGEARLDEASMEILRMGLRIHALQLGASGDYSRQMDIVGSARSGDGELMLSGQLRPQPDGVWSLDLAMSGQNFEVANIPEARMQVSPNLRARVIGREIHLEGELDIPSARLEPRDLSRAVRPSDDVVIVNSDEAREQPELWLIHTRMRVSANDSIRFIGYGFDGRIGGDLLLIDEPGSITRGRGVLHAVAGSTYTTFGRELTIEHGRLSFADSPVDNPNLDIRAARTIGDVTAGVNVSGTAKKPLLTLYSEPSMDQADILSYLTLGHPVSDASQSDGETLAGAANSAGLVGGNYLAGYIGRQFGLEEARVETDPTTQSPWVIAGKYLSPRLYIRYGVGVYEDAYSVLVRYHLSEHWQVQGEGGLHSGGDIIYTFERP